MAILLVDDDPRILQSLHTGISKLTSWPVAEAGSAAAALRMFKEKPFRLVISDIRMPDMDGLALLKEIGRLERACSVIMLTAFGTIELAVECLKNGAYDFLTKPVELHSLASLINRALGGAKPPVGLGGLVGRSEAMQTVFHQIEVFARTDSTVLITGESGTGKELTARAIHALSERCQGKLVVVNCPAIPGPVLESELFGHTRGAFTNAVADRKGLFEEAHGGTLILDEIADLPLGLQAKLLRILEDREVRPVGSNRSRKVDVRCIALTNADLRARIEAKEFRADLYHRLNVLRLHLPPLRERREDIPWLAAHFHGSIAAKAQGKRGRSAQVLCPEALKLLAEQPWPGNVRELRNVIERSVLLSESPSLGPENLQLEAEVPAPPAPRGRAQVNVIPYRQAKNDFLEDFSRTYFASVLDMSEGNITLAAQKCGLKRQQLQWAVQRYGLRGQAGPAPELGARKVLG
jgi:DNA-binding NtrC family response regulator